MDDDNFIDENYKTPLNAESLLAMHLNRVAVFRDSDPVQYVSSIETLVLLSPRKIREKALSYMDELGLVLNLHSAVTESRKSQYDKLFMFVSGQLEKDNMIWRTRRVKTYE